MSHAIILTVESWHLPGPFLPEDLFEKGTTLTLTEQAFWPETAYIMEWQNVPQQFCSVGPIGATGSSGPLPIFVQGKPQWSVSVSITMRETQDIFDFTPAGTTDVYRLRAKRTE